MSFADQVIAHIDWDSYEVCAQSGADLASTLSAFVNSQDSDQARDLWWGIENVAFAQNTLYPAAEPTVEVLIAALADDRPLHIRRWVIELLRFLLSAGSPTDPELIVRCRQRARMGLWLLAREARREQIDWREAVLEVASLVDAERAAE